jgi:ATP-binding cassette subfamily B (MDR/TAP) protein 1
VEQGKHDELVAAGNIYSRLVKAQDLSTFAKDDATEDGQEDEPQPDMEKMQSLARYNTSEARNLGSLKDQEDFSLFRGPGLVMSVIKLIKISWDLKYWYFVILISCFVGGKCREVGLNPKKRTVLLTFFFFSQPPSSRGNRSPRRPELLI